jgi:hypothetical protein
LKEARAATVDRGDEKAPSKPAAKPARKKKPAPQRPIINQ